MCHMHHPLCKILGKNKGIPPLAPAECRGGKCFSEPIYQYKIQHIAGTQINLADCMSRLPKLVREA